ncbi:MAG: hypothetical protein GDA55_00415 [Cellvibrionales bacterium]|nr:hypothetical protein [Cellvibrionales bacterium]
MPNTSLNDAIKAKNDEFYTQLSDIENEMRHYKPLFRDKVIYCNCDDPRVSKFFHYFSYNFEHGAVLDNPPSGYHEGNEKEPYQPIQARPFD